MKNDLKVREPWADLGEGHRRQREQREQGPEAGMSVASAGQRGGRRGVPISWDSGSQPGVTLLSSVH